MLLDRLPLYSRRWSCVIYGKMEYYMNIFIKDFDKLESTTNNIDRVVGYTYLETNNGRPFFMIFWWKIQGSGMRAVQLTVWYGWVTDHVSLHSYLTQTLTDQFGGLKPMLDGCLRNKEKWQELPPQSLPLGAIFCF